MARATWSGSISFGLVNVPVKLYSAVKEKGVHFHQLHEGTGARIRYKKVSDKTGRELDDASIVKGYELSNGSYVTLTDDDLASVEPERSHTIAVEDFVPWDEIDPMHFDSTYWVAPDGSKGAAKSYALLHDAMESSGRVGIGRFVMRTREHLVTLRPTEGAIALHGMHFPDEIISANEVAGLPLRGKATPREVKIAQQLIDSLSVGWDPKRYKDTYRKAVLAMIKRKSEGKDVVAPEKAPEPEAFDDLMAALEASVKESKSRRSTGTRRKTRKSTPRPRKAAKKRSSSRG
jgi:DNA end-binding protein Ku